MNRNEQEYYANIGNIARALDRIANALENNNKEDKIYYKTRKDMFMDNPCTKEEWEEYHKHKDFHDQYQFIIKNDD